MATIPSNKKQLLERWHKRLREQQASQYEAAKPMATMNLVLGIPVVVLTTFVGTSVFATLEKEVALETRIIVGCVSVAAAVLAGLQTFLRFSEKAEKHRATGALAGSVRREIEQLIASENIDAIPNERIDKLREQINQISEGAPNVPARIWEKIEQRFKDDYR